MRRTRSLGRIVGYLRDSHTVSSVSRGTYSACLRSRDSGPFTADGHSLLGTQPWTPSPTRLFLPQPCVSVRPLSSGSYPTNDAEPSSRHAAEPYIADIDEPPSTQEQENEYQDGAADIKSLLLSASLRHVVLS